MQKKLLMQLVIMEIGNNVFGDAIETGTGDFVVEQIKKSIISAILVNGFIPYLPMKRSNLTRRSS
jgi:hypothetical protein